MADKESVNLLSPFRSIDFGIADWADGIKKLGYRKSGLGSTDQVVC